MSRNDEVAVLLAEFTDLLEATGVEYKSTAYRRAGEIQAVSRFSVKTEENIAENMPFVQESRKRTRLGDTRPVANATLAHLVGLDPVKLVGVCSSIRRWKDTIGDIDPSEPTLSIENLETFDRVFRLTNLELLEAIVKHEPESIRELARLVNRNPPEVLENVNELADYGLIELKENGRAKRPVMWYDGIDADIPLTSGSEQDPKADA